MILEQVAHINADRQQCVALKVGGLAVIVSRYAHVAYKHVRESSGLRFTYGMSLRHHFSYKIARMARITVTVAAGLSPNNCFPSLRYLPRIDEGYSRRLEISDVASDHRHTMHKGSGRDECIAAAKLVGYMQPGAA